MTESLAGAIDSWMAARAARPRHEGSARHHRPPPAIRRRAEVINVDLTVEEFARWCEAYSNVDTPALRF